MIKNTKIFLLHRQEDLYCEKGGCKFYKNSKTKTGVQKYESVNKSV